MKRVPASELHAAQIIEWADRRCRVLSVRAAREREHRRQYASHRPGVIVSVQPDGPFEGRRHLHYWADEEVTVLGWSFGAD